MVVLPSDEFGAAAFAPTSAADGAGQGGAGAAGSAVGEAAAAAAAVEAPSLAGAGAAERALDELDLRLQRLQATQQSRRAELDSYLVALRAAPGAEEGETLVEFPPQLADGGAAPEPAPASRGSDSPGGMAALRQHTTELDAQLASQESMVQRARAGELGATSAAAKSARHKAGMDAAIAKTSNVFVQRNAELAGLGRLGSHRLLTDEQRQRVDEILADETLENVYAQQLGRARDIDTRLQELNPNFSPTAEPAAPVAVALSAGRAADSAHEARRQANAFLKAEAQRRRNLNRMADLEQQLRNLQTRERPAVEAAAVDALLERARTELGDVEHLTDDAVRVLCFGARGGD